ncbi:MAG: hypothetical protein H6713_00175 [Myxococcales bacterium]|nr:hypothetical protein [Myxococcales bacterium]MCB9748397.1 hypothetical protein [Myxococcales bacterium]
MLTVGLAALAGACASTSRPDTRGLHYIGDTLVYSQPGDYRAYDAYIRARVAMEGEHPDLERAHRLVLEALYYERRDPHLWTTRGEIELRMGNLERARRSSRIALDLRPGYPPARSLLSRLAAADAPRSAGRP